MSSIANIRTDDAPHIEAISPSQAVVLDANRIEYVVDDLGRRLGVKRITSSLRRRVLKALTAESGEKGDLFVMAMYACCCVSIDGAPVAFPMSEVAVDALIDRLETEGLRAVAITLGTKFAPVKKDGEDTKDELKNS